LEYARLNIIEQLMSMKYEQIIRVNSDGIYFTGNCVCYNNYRVKPSECFDEDSGKFTTYNNTDFFCSNTNIGFVPNYAFGVERKFYKTEIAIGGGGSGKTHYNLADSGLVNCMYIAPTWKLARNKAAEYGCRVGTHAGMLTCDATNDMYQSPVYIIDEVSMMSDEEKNTILGFYKFSKLIFCGDINYQLPFVVAHKKGVHTTFKMEGFDNIMRFDVDYRAKCSILQNLKKHIRACIDSGEMYVSNTLMQQFNIVDKTYVFDNYKIDDMVLCNSNKKKDMYSDTFQHMEKYYITKSGQKYSCGEIIIGKPETTDCEIRHAYTVHSIQGETCRTNLYIEATGMDMRMFYTAISRACYINQIFLIR
jgi:hypothetical protein